MRTRVFNGKEQIFCEWRHRWVRLTPEEWVRQQLLHRLVEQLGYPASLIAVEVSLEKITNDKLPITNKKLRADAVVYNRAMQPLMLIECKAETVPLTQKTLDQAVIYNRRLNVPYLLLHNGPQTIFVDLTEENLRFSDSIPQLTIE
ncbi:MAG: type I restriction enzyme HsdR N-terminal domain-containing protein [Paludibacteraceae bacterium]|nr:type I restriction enzyme HsdR N-terminal domain-containing protein [Paludibacteraceae bacterium]